MKQISNKEYERYQHYQTDKLHGRILTPDGLRVVCAGLDNDPEKIGKHMLEMLTKFRNEGLFDIICREAGATGRSHQLYLVGHIDSAVYEQRQCTNFAESLFLRRELPPDLYRLDSR